MHFLMQFPVLDMWVRPLWLSALYVFELFSVVIKFLTIRVATPCSASHLSRWARDMYIGA